MHLVEEDNYLQKASELESQVVPFIKWNWFNHKKTVLIVHLCCRR